jgi:hypothetical protein
MLEELWLSAQYVLEHLQKTSTQYFDFALHEREHRLPNFTRALNHWLRDISHTIKIFKTLDFIHINNLVLNKESIGIKYLIEKYLILFCYSFNSIICLTFTWYICLENVEWIVDFFSQNKFNNYQKWKFIWKIFLPFFAFVSRLFAEQLFSNYKPNQFWQKIQWNMRSNWFQTQIQRLYNPSEMCGHNYESLLESDSQ